MKKINILAALILITAMLFASCGKEESSGLKIVDQNLIIWNQLNEEFDFSTVKTCADEHKRIEELTKLSDNIMFKKLGVLYYTVLKTNEGLTIFWFSNILAQGDTSEIFCDRMEVIRFSDAKYEKPVSSLEKGTALSEVMQTDPDGDYHLFLYTSWSGCAKISYHYFENGNAYEIYYDDNWHIDSVYRYTI